VINGFFQKESRQSKLSILNSNKNLRNARRPFLDGVLSGNPGFPEVPKIFQMLS
jgi:hypothetical protein